MKLQQIGPILLILLAFTATARAAEAVKQVTIYRIFSEADNGDQAALNRLHGLAQEGNATGEFCLGDYLWNKKKQYVDAIAWFRKAAKNGNGWGEFSLGVAYSSMGHGVPKSNITALKWWYIAESHRDDADMAARNDAGRSKYVLVFCWRSTNDICRKIFMRSWHIRFCEGFLEFYYCVIYLPKRGK